MEIAILVTLIVGFIITWIVCAVSSSSENDSLKMIHDNRSYRERELEYENDYLKRKLYAVERELYYRRYDRPVPVDINLDVKVETNETTSKSSCR